MIENGQSIKKDENKYDLAERTAMFGEEAVRFSRSIPLDSITSPLVKQLVRASTSVGANYSEADEAGTKKEFRYRISICSREARESKHWLRMIVVAVPEVKEKARSLWKEANELNLIFASIFRNSKPKMSSDNWSLGFGHWSFFVKNVQ
jgi:four helix bundle protein